MAPPPCYKDLGKAAKDLFTKGYNIGQVKVESTSKAGANGEVQFKTGATHTFENGAFAGNLQVKYKIPDYGLVLTEKWNTDNSLSTGIEVNDQFCRGLKLALDSSYTPQTGKRIAKAKAELLLSKANIDFDVGIDAGPTLNFSAVFGHENWLFGVETSLDTAASKLGGTNFSFGLQGENFALLSFVKSSRKFGASVFHHAAPNCEIGSELSWAIGEHFPHFGLATKYVASKEIELKAKVSNDSKVAFAVTHSLSDRAKLSLSTQLSLTSLHEGGQKFGLGLEYGA